jgi:hypothetical protein
MHLELWVTLRKDRTRASRNLRRAYSVARRITQDRGGSGPWVFLVDADPPDPKTARLRTTLALRPGEDLWVELVFYPSKVRGRNIIRQIWKDPQFAVHAAALDGLVSRRKAGYQAMLAYARQKLV